jgi:dTDP-4-amino-4,6-dideoxygalactose transaminase
MILTADPKAGYLAHAEEIRAAIDRVLASGHYILGPEVEAFEKAFSVYQDGGHTVTVANGTDALEIALRALGVGPGDRVATVANTVTATVSAIEQTGAQPVFVEIDAASMTMSAAALEAALMGERGAVKVVIPVHLYGCPADMPTILEVAAKYGATVVEDCAQSHGAMIAGRKTGTFGEAAAFSFYPTKNLGALGDGGAIFTKNAALAERMRMVRQYGWKTRYVSEMPGRNSRLDELQAAILRVKLRHLDGENARRREWAARYVAKLAGVPGIKLPEVKAGVEHVFHQFTIRTPEREALRVELLGKGIACGVLYPVPVHRQPAFLSGAWSLPETERACEEVLCLPCHLGVTSEDVDRVCGEILRWATHP